MPIYPAIENEGEILTKFNTALGLDVEKTNYRFCRMDGIGSSSVVEIKTRKNNYAKYPTTMLPQDKVDYWRSKHAGKDFYCVFRFLDGDYYYKWDDADEILVEDGGRTDRDRPEIKPYCYIPITSLTQF